MSRKPPSDHNKISRKAGYPCFEPCIMAASSLWQPLIFLRTWILREINSFWTGTLNRIWELKSFVRDKFTLSRMFEPDLRASKLCGREMSLEPDFKPESLFWTDNFLTVFKFSSIWRCPPEPGYHSLQWPGVPESCHCSPRVLRLLEELAWDSPYLTVI